MSAHGFTSAFASELDAYLSFKEKMGFYGTSRIWYLKRFDAYCTANGRTVFDRETVEGWVTAQLARSDGRYRSWMSYIRDVGRWLRAHRASDAYVLSDRWRAPVVPAHPYLLTTIEIERFFAAARCLHAHSPWAWQGVAFFTLMHSCGLRTGETRLLQPDRIDLREGHLDVVWSKGNRSRRLPLVRPGHRDPHRLRSDNAQTVRPIPADLLRLRHRKPGHPHDGREDVQPHLGPGSTAATCRWATAKAL